MNMTVRTLGAASSRRTSRPSLLDVAAQALVADPAASLAEVAEAAGIGRTTLHKHYATRDDLLRAVGDRALDLWEQAVGEVADPDDGAAPDGGLLAMAAAMIPIGPQLAFLLRTPAFDHVPEINDRWAAVEERTLAVLKRARARGVIAESVPDWWLLATFFALIYVAAESVGAGRLAPLDAPEFTVRTFLQGIGAAPPAGTDQR
jgi:AcrR family transcriptional regulator